MKHAVLGIASSPLASLEWLAGYQGDDECYVLHRKKFGLFLTKLSPLDSVLAGLHHVGLSKSQKPYEDQSCRAGPSRPY